MEVDISSSSATWPTIAVVQFPDGVLVYYARRRTSVTHHVPGNAMAA
jgi:hypothetical protein